MADQELKAAAQAIIDDALEGAEDNVHVCDRKNIEAKFATLKPSVKALYDALNAEPAVQNVQASIAYARKWHVDGEVPTKVRNEKNRLVWPAKFKWLPVTPNRIYPDDIALIAAPSQSVAVQAKALTDEQIIDLADDFKSTYRHAGIDFPEFDYMGFAHALLDSRPSATPYAYAVRGLILNEKPFLVFEKEIADGFSEANGRHEGTKAYEVFPVYRNGLSAPADVAAVRDAALEEAAMVCRDYSQSMQGNGLSVAADACCERILKIKESL